MPNESGYFFVNAGSTWPAVALGPNVQVSNGLISLKKTGSTFATAGSFLAGPFQISDRPTTWFRVLASMSVDTAAVASHAQFYTLTALSGPAPWNPLSTQPFSDPRWKAAPRDALDFVITNSPDLVLFVGGFFRGDGTDTPQLDEQRVDYGRDTYTKYLPPV